MYKVLPVMKNDKAPSPKAVRLQWSSRAERRAQSPPGSTSPHVSGHETAAQILCVLIPIFPPHTGQVTSASGLCPRSSPRHRRPDLSPGHLQLRSGALALTCLFQKLLSDSHSSLLAPVARNQQENPWNAASRRDLFFFVLPSIVCES